MSQRSQEQMRISERRPCGKVGGAQGWGDVVRMESSHRSHRFNSDQDLTPGPTPRPNHCLARQDDRL